MPVQTLEEEALSVVLLGSFNPAIFQLQWFVRMALIAEADAKPEASNLKVISHDVTEISFLGLTLQCLGDRFTMSTPNPARFEPLQEIVLKILEILPHTPLKACGINRTMHYRVQDEEYWHKIGHTLVHKEPIWKPLFPDPRTNSVSIKQKREGDYPGDINVTVQPSLKYHPGIFVKTNWHYPVAGSADESNPRPKIKGYLEHCWASACSQAKDVAEAVFMNVPANG